ncbi:MAG: glycogen-binding domain-containing protein, partial [Elusimicrobiota bacterium]
NNWADNQNGVVSNEEYLMEKDKGGVWTKVMKLSTGRYQYKFVVDGNWILDPANPEKFKEPNGNENSVVKVMPKGVELGPKVTKDGMKFTYYAPNAEKVYLAGEFNNWADNQNGVVTNDDYLMEKGKDGVWFKVEKLETGEYKYKFVVDGAWVADSFGDSAGDENGNSLIIVK